MPTMVVAALSWFEQISQASKQASNVSSVCTSCLCWSGHVLWLSYIVVNVSRDAKVSQLQHGALVACQHNVLSRQCAGRAGSVSMRGRQCIAAAPRSILPTWGLMSRCSTWRS